MAKGKITSDTDLKNAKVFDFLTFSFDGDVEGDLYFRVEGPGSSGSSRVGVEQKGQFQVQQIGDFEVAFTDGENDLATKKFTIKAPDEA